MNTPHETLKTLGAKERKFGYYLKRMDFYLRQPYYPEDQALLIGEIKAALLELGCNFTQEALTKHGYMLTVGFNQSERFDCASGETLLECYLSVYKQAQERSSKEEPK